MDVFAERRAGVLLHPTSLPGTVGNGDLGKEAYQFIDFLAECGVRVWQTLPLGPTHEDRSPYQCLSVHAGDYRLISLQGLVEHGWLDDAELDASGDLDEQRKVRLAAASNGFPEQGQVLTIARPSNSFYMIMPAGWMILRFIRHCAPSEQRQGLV